MRSQNAQLLKGLRECKDKVKEMEDKNDPPDKLSEGEKTYDENEEQEDGNQNQVISKVCKKPTVINIQTFKENIIETRDLLFLRKDNITYLTDTNGTCLFSPPCAGNFDLHT